MKHKENWLKNYLASSRERGFTLIEILLSIAVFLILAAGALGAYTVLVRTTKAAREKTILSALADNYLEIVRNLPYSQVGTIVGNPNGSLPDLTNAASQSIEGTVYKIYYEVTYVDDPADGTIVAGTDPAPDDYKQVKMSILNTATNQVTTFLTNISPKGLEGLSNAGALFIKVFDATGQPVSGANIHIQKTDNTIILDRTSDSSGNWIEVGLPAGVNAYHIVVTKSGYSSDQTYPITVSNPNPIKPDATIVNTQVTQVSFAIDLVSTLIVKTLDDICQPISGVNMNIAGAKLIGTNPNVLKFNNNYTSSAGQVLLNNLEWDTYTPTLLTGQSWVLRGTSPIQQVNVLPNTTQTFTMILGTGTTAYSLLVIVKDAATGTALEFANVHLQKGGSQPQDYYGTTGGSVWVQSDWTGGPGQDAFADKTQYFSDDGNVDINSVPTGLRLNKITGRYVTSGSLESSTFDSGAASDFTSITWDPTSQDPATTLKFQIASSGAADGGAGGWQYKGPDGTSNSYYTVSGTTISSVHDGDRYVRYKAFLSTTDDKKTPVATSVHINYVSGCYTPGQTFFGDLTSGQNYSLDVSLSGYQTQTFPTLNITGNQTLEVLMTP